MPRGPGHRDRTLRLALVATVAGSLWLTGVPVGVFHVPPPAPMRPGGGGTGVSTLEGPAVGALAAFGLSSEVSVGGSPVDTVLDPALGESFVYGGCALTVNSSCVVAVNDSTRSVVGSTVLPRTLPAEPLYAAPGSMALDPATGNLYFGSMDWGNVTVVSTTSLSVVAYIDVGGCPAGEAYDPSLAEVFVANVCSTDLTVISGTSNTVVGTVPLAADSEGIVLDPRTGQLFVGLLDGNGTVDVVAPANGTVVASVPSAGGANGTLVYDPASSAVLAGGGPLVAISDTNDTIVAASWSLEDSWGAAFVPQRQELLFSEYICGTSGVGNPCLVVVNATTYATVRTIPFPLYPNGIAYDPVARTAVIAEGGGEVAFAGGGYNVTLAQSGLPSGIAWSATLAGIGWTFTTAPNLTFVEPNGTYAFVASNLGLYYPVPSHGNLTVAGSDVVQTITYDVRTYPVTFTESGLGTGTAWYVTVGGRLFSGTGPQISVAEANGTYAYAVANVSGYVFAIPGGNTSGAVTVEGAGVNLTVVFTPGYLVTFTESGLPYGTDWVLTLSGQAHTVQTGAITFTLVNGSYAFATSHLDGYTVNDPTGTVVVDGSAVTVAVVYTPFVYPVLVTERGLPAGTAWSVSVGSHAANTTNATLTVELPNGTFLVYASTGPGFLVAPQFPTVTIAGRGANLTILGAVTYRIDFTASGLPAGTSWSVELNGATQSTASGPIVFAEPNGSFWFTVSSVGGYTASPSSSLVVVNGFPVSWDVAFLPPPPAPPAPAPAPFGQGWLGLPGYAGLALLGWNGLLSALVVAALLRRGRRPPAPPLS